jgi:DNA polymerase-3 subunit epsilon
MEFFFDVETSGFHKKGIDPADLTQAWIVQLGFILSTSERIYHEGCFIFQPLYTESSIHPMAEKTHGISALDCAFGGIREVDVANLILQFLPNITLVVCHNYNFDSEFMKDMFLRSFYGDTNNAEWFTSLPHCCTMLESTDYCKLPGRWGKPKWPKLEELYHHLFNEDFEGAHDALADVRATRRCFYELKERKVI